VTATSSPRRQRLLSNLLLGIISLAVFTGALEGVSRWLERRKAPSADDGTLPRWHEGWGADFYTLGSDPIGFPPRHRFNSEGLRDRSRPLSKAQGTVRVVALGDSVTYGYGVNPAQAWPQQLEALWRSQGREVDVLNVALPAWSTRQQLIAYQRIARRYRPEVVLLGVCLNDIPELTANLNPPPPVLTWLHRHSAVYRLLLDAPGLEQRSVRELFRDPGPPRVRESFARFFEEVRSLRGAVTSDGASLALVIFPFRFQVEPEAPAPRAQERIKGFCSEEGIRCLDLLPAIAALGTSAFLDHDHLTPAGAERTASAVAESGLVAVGPSAPEVLQAALGGEGGWSSERLVSALRGSDVNVRVAAAWCLGREIAESDRGDGLARTALARALSDASERVRLAAARGLDRATGTDADMSAMFPALFRALDDGSEAVRWAAAEALWDDGTVEKAYVPELIRALDSHDPHVQAFAVWTLGRIGPEAGAAASRLAAVMADAEPALRSRVAQALGGIGGPAIGAVPALAAALLDRSEEVRREAARALGRIGPPARDAVPALTRARGDGDEGVRHEVERALTRIGAS
jgi:HEAT repeat protein/lysophospholipase L1-like esterase